MQEPREIGSQAEYEAEVQPDRIPVAGTEDDVASRRLEEILDIRKFEIDLYWRRAAYFWSFIAAALTGYGLTISADKPNEAGLLKFQFVILCLGLVFSLAWYLVNKGSKFWQEDWEKHMDLTEDRVIGPLYKTTISKKTYSSFWNPTAAYAASVSKINQILSLFLLLIWISNAIHFVHEYVDVFGNADLYYVLIGATTVATVLYLLFGTGTRTSDTVVHFHRRSVCDKVENDEGA